MCAEHIAAVVGNIEPLVTVGRPRVGQFHSAHEVAGRRACGRPQPERAVDVHPRAMVAGDGNRRREVVEGAAVHVARLQAHDGRACRLGRQYPGQFVPDDRSVDIGRHWLEHAGAQTEQPQRAIDRRVPFARGHHPDRRCSDQTVLLDVMPHTGKDLMPGSSVGDARRPPGLSIRCCA